MENRELGTEVTCCWRDGGLNANCDSPSVRLSEGSINKLTRVRDRIRGGFGMAGQPPGSQPCGPAGARRRITQARFLMRLDSGSHEVENV